MAHWRWFDISWKPNRGNSSCEVKPAELAMKKISLTLNYMSSITPGYILWADLTWRDLDLLFQGMRRLQVLWGCWCSHTSLEHLPWEGLNFVPAEHLACPWCNQQCELQDFVFMGYITLGAFQVYEHLCWKCESWSKNEIQTCSV